MGYHRFAIIASLLGLSILFVTPGTAHTQDEPAPVAAEQAEGVEVLARGPIHEAFAEPGGNRAPEPTRIVLKQPPEPIPEQPPDEKPADENVKWFPGYWAWDEDRSDFIWVSGIWRVPPPDRQWVPGHWVQAQDQEGWQWVAGFWLMQKQDEVHFLPPPPEPVQARPSTPAPTENSVYVPGTWIYRETRYYWRPGYWCDYRPGWVWIPAHYVWTPAGYVFVEGYWDYELSRRGLLFAPVYFGQPLWARPAWYYRPYFVVETDFVLGSLFVRTGAPCYYFGDYFEPVYRHHGFVPWINISFQTPFGYDPLLSYYRWHHRDSRWERDLRGLYTARLRGEAPRPPRTLVQQNTLIQNITVNKTVNVTNVKNVTALVSLPSVDRSVVKLQPLAREQRAAEEKHVQELRQFSRQRSQVETQLRVNKSTPVRATDPPHTVKLELPQPAVAAKPVEKAPPPPVVIHPTVKPAQKPDSILRMGPHVDIKPEAKPQPKPEIKPVQPRTEVKTEVKRPTPGPEVKPSTPKPEPKQEVKPVAPAPRPEVKPEPKPQPKPEPKPPAPKPEVKPEPKPMPKPEPKPASPPPRSEVKPEPKPQPKPEVKPEPKPASPPPRSEVKPEPKPQPKPEVKPEPKPMPKPEPKPEVKPPARPSTPPPARPPAPPMKPDPGKANPQDKKP
jgi:hypothetical protein